MRTKNIFFSLTISTFVSLLAMEKAKEIKRIAEDPLPHILKKARPLYIHFYSAEDEHFRIPQSAVLLSTHLSSMVQTNSEPQVRFTISAARLAEVVECLDILYDTLFTESGYPKMLFRHMASERLITHIHKIIGPTHVKGEMVKDFKAKFIFIDDCITIGISCLAHFMTHYIVLTLPTLNMLRPAGYPSDLAHDLLHYQGSDELKKLFHCYMLNLQNIHVFEQFKEDTQEELSRKIPASIKGLSVEPLLEFLLINDFLGIQGLVECFAYLIAKRLNAQTKRIEDVAYNTFYGTLTESLKELIVKHMAL